MTISGPLASLDAKQATAAFHLARAERGWKQMANSLRAAGRHADASSIGRFERAAALLVALGDEVAALYEQEAAKTAGKSGTRELSPKAALAHLGPVPTRITVDMLDAQLDGIDVGVSVMTEHQRTLADEAVAMGKAAWARTDDGVVLRWKAGAP